MKVIEYSSENFWELLDEHLSLRQRETDVKIEQRVKSIIEDVKKFGDDKIIQFAETNLNENGVLYFEINPIFVEQLTSLLKQSYESIEVRNDFLNSPRMIRASKSKIKT